MLGKGIKIRVRVWIRVMIELELGLGLGLGIGIRVRVRGGATGGASGCVLLCHPLILCVSRMSWNIDSVKFNLPRHLTILTF